MGVNKKSTWSNTEWPKPMMMCMASKHVVKHTYCSHMLDKLCRQK
jgi:hypothetical protein